MEKIEEFDIVVLKDGREGTVVCASDNCYDIDAGDSPENWETLYCITDDDIESIIWKYKKSE